MNAKTSKDKLLEGNERFVSGCQQPKKNEDLRIKELAEKGQKPFALIVCCSDSRVPPEIIFDQGLGEIFVVRTAGNVLDKIGMGSVEYGAEHLHIPLIVVLGHGNCGAVKATVDGGEAEGCICAIIDKIKVSLDKLPETKNVYEACENENIKTTVNEIKCNPIIAHLINKGETEVCGAKYMIDTGKVVFF